MRRLRLALLALVAAALALGALLWQLNYGDGVDVGRDEPLSGDAATRVARGAYLARIGNCLACHTARGGAPGAGGLPLATPFGTLYSSNLTPDAQAGIGRWSAAAFWRALHHGRSADGHLLYPAFPYTHTTLLTRVDADAVLAYLRTLPPSPAQPPAHELRWPYSTQAALAVWRALYFRPASFVPDPARAPAWNRGAYLVRGVAHCSACHGARNAWGGADWDRLDGGLMRAQGWYAPSLLDPREAGVADWPADDVTRLLATGQAHAGSAAGPMAEVVLHGTQYLSDADLRAITSYLQALPGALAPAAAPASAAAPPAPSRLAAAGQQVYDKQCADCHGRQGEGVPAVFPALAGNRAVALAHTENLLQAVLYGGYGAATAGHPRPYGMPPFTLALTDSEIAAVLTYIRASWGNRAAEVSPLDVHRMRAAMAQTVPP